MDKMYYIFALFPWTCSWLLKQKLIICVFISVF